MPQQGCSDLPSPARHAFRRPNWSATGVDHPSIQSEHVDEAVKSNIAEVHPLLRSSSKTSGFRCIWALEDSCVSFGSYRPNFASDTLRLGS